MSHPIFGRRLPHYWGVLLLLLTANLEARLQIEITAGVESAVPIAIVPFAATEALPEDIAAIISNDLARSGQFAPLAAAKLPARPSEGSDIEFEQWRTLGVDHIVVGQVSRGGEGYTVRFQLFDLHRGRQLTGYALPVGSASGLRQAAHQVSDLVYEQLTGIKGVFNTHIIYVTSHDGAKGRVFELKLADSDGFNEKTILTSSQPLLSPAWSPDGKQIAYVSFEGKRSEVYLQDVARGSREKIAAFEGLNSAPTFSPDGRKLALTLSKDGNAEIYLLDIATKQLQRLTRSYAIDTEPAFSPDGRTLVFTSDRGGQPQIYRLRLDGSYRVMGRPERLTFEGSYNASAVFAPDGKQLALVHRYRESFRIALLDIESYALRILTDSSLDESPAFAANGTMIIYATEEGGRGVLQVVAVDGGARQRLGLAQGDVREPAWSPYLY
ncbi:Tol-Pal system beta propeller repeat protein TolB [Ectothiorhodospiraceae bacterium BW-2]|nr:Tol-Pal system beta propeller repeat protein TolB [Ectothiorhodospiraceae bacterium BW-2]